MTGIGLLAQTLHTHLVKGSSPLAGKGEDLVRSIDEAQKQLRSIVRELLPVEAIPEGLMVALQELTAQAETQYSLRCNFRCERPVYVDDPGAAKHVFRIVQEALNNAVRHGKPTHITISLEQLDGRLEVAVSDNGTGVRERPDGHSGIGLESMRQRAHLLGGDLFDSTSGRRRHHRTVLDAVALGNARGARPHARRTWIVPGRAHVQHRANLPDRGKTVSTRVEPRGSARQKPQPPVRRLRIVIVDDHPIVRKGLTELLNGEADMIVCGESDTVAGGFERIRDDRPDVAIVDLSLGIDSGLRLVKQLDASLPEVRVLVLSMHEETLHAERALSASGARGATS